eukprot:3417469-Rhodomonas_salina.1
MPQGLPNSNATNRDGGSGLERSAKQPSCITTRSSAAHLGLATRGRAELEAEVDLLKPVARTSERGDHDRLQHPEPAAVSLSLSLSIMETRHASLCFLA